MEAEGLRNHPSLLWFYDVLWIVRLCALLSPSFHRLFVFRRAVKGEVTAGTPRMEVENLHAPCAFRFFFRPQIIHGWDAAHNISRPKSFCSPFGRGFRCCTSSFCFAGEYTSLHVSVDEALTVHWLARLVASKRWNGKQSCIFKKICKHTTSSLFGICSTGMSQAHVWTHIATYKLKSLEVKYQYYSTTVCHRHR